jgi:hypothetical protein
VSTRRGWLSLSEKYRRRLERAGIGRREYESGASLKTARGHSTTPESIREYQNNPSRFKEYRQRRKGLVDRVIQKKKEAFETTIHWNEENSKTFATKGKVFVKDNQKDFIKPPTLKQLQQIDAMTVDELIDFQMVKKDEDDWRFLWYH